MIQSCPHSLKSCLLQNHHMQKILNYDKKSTPSSERYCDIFYFLFDKFQHKIFTLKIIQKEIFRKRGPKCQKNLKKYLKWVLNPKKVIPRISIIKITIILIFI